MERSRSIHTLTSPGLLTHSSFKITGIAVKKTEPYFKYPVSHAYRTIDMGGKRLSAVRFPSPPSPRCDNGLTATALPQTTEAPLVFADLRTTEEEDDACADESFLTALGSIDLKYCRIKNVKVQKASRATFAAASSSKAVYEAAKKASSLSHQTGFALFTSALKYGGSPFLLSGSARNAQTPVVAARRHTKLSTATTSPSPPSRSVTAPVASFRWRARSPVRLVPLLPRLHHSDFYSIAASPAPGEPAPPPIAGPSNSHTAKSPSLGRDSRSPSVEIAGAQSALDLKRKGRLDEDDPENDSDPDEYDGGEDDDEEDDDYDGYGARAGPAPVAEREKRSRSSKGGEAKADAAAQVEGKDKAAQIAALKRKLAELEGVDSEEDDEVMRKEIKKEEGDRVEQEKLERRKRGIKPQVIDVFSDSE